uniref:Cytochrome b n=1 Tax=Tubulipora flabellaris TaxID=365325 RepID=F6GPJ4_9BILA|nr:cytochrome b [Tubulipora flabellaris]ACB12465.1 cytochrome b [Tubulipora flabellaris]
MLQLRQKEGLKLATSALYDLPTSINLNYFYNYGSMLGGCLAIQLITGFLLATHFVPHILFSFDSISHITRDLKMGWLMRLIHANGASMFFACIYMHVGRGLYFSSYRNYKTWATGVVLFVLSILTAFMGYVLVWGQMSYWAATVITNLLSVIPIIGKTLVEWLWGGFAIGLPTLTRFYALHFIAPFVLTVLVLIHLILLHEKLTPGPSGLANYDDMVWFHPYFSLSDGTTVLMMLFIFMAFVTFFPFTFLDPENFLEANTMMTPEHILPEWYFLPFYAILRSIPNKLLGVVMLLLSLLVLLILPFLNMKRCRSFSPFHKILFWFFLSNFLFLGWIGMMPVEDPFIVMGLISTVFYFFLITVKNV